MTWISVGASLLTAILIVLSGKINMRQYLRLREENLTLHIRITTLEYLLSAKQQESNKEELH